NEPKRYSARTSNGFPVMGGRCLASRRVLRGRRSRPTRRGCSARSRRRGRIPTSSCHWTTCRLAESRLSGWDGLPARADQRVGFETPALADLLPPHRIVEPLLIKELVVAPHFDNPTPLQDVDAVRVQDRRKPVGDHDGDSVTLLGD